MTWFFIKSEEIILLCLCEPYFPLICKARVYLHTVWVLMDGTSADIAVPSQENGFLEEMEIFANQ